MAKASSWFLGAGCLLVVLGAAIMALLVHGLSAPALPRNMVVALTVSGPIAEVTADDPISELMGEQPTSLRKLGEALNRAAEDDRVRGLRVRVDSVGGGLATAQELRALIHRFNAAGKWTSAYIDTAGEFTPGNFIYYVASACDEIVMNPQGDVNLIGFSARVPFLRGTFDKLDIKAEFPGRGAYKTARFMYTQRDFTPAHREMMDWLLGSFMDQLVDAVAASRGLESSQVRNLIDRAPFLGEEAVDVGLVDRLEDWTAYTEGIEDREPDARIVGAHSYLKRSRFAERGPRIAVVTAVGAILRGENRRDVNPLLGGEIMGSSTIARAFRNVRKAGGVEAVVFRIDSPGGSALASEIIRQEMIRTAEDIPVVVSMSNVAGSGGYWITCGAQRIVADPGTITGSIGVFAGHLNMDGFWTNKLGVTYGRVDTAANADIYGSLEDWTDEQRAVVDRMLDRFYDTFVDQVADSRDMTREAVDAIGRGRVFTGEQALENGLVDVLGGFDDAVVEAKILAGLDPDAPVTLLEYPRVEPWWRQLANRGRSDEIGAALAVLERWVGTGEIDVPGVVWMPPITIQ